MHKFRITRVFMVLLLSLTLVMTGFSGVSASTTITPANASAKVDGASYLRSSTSTSSKAKKLLADNTKLTVKRVIFKKKSSTSSTNKWYYVTVGSTTGYIRSDCVDTFTYTVVLGKTTSDLNYRSGAGTGMTKKGTFKKGSSVSVVLASKDSDGNEWLKIKKGSSYYYVSKKYVAPQSNTSGNSDADTKDDVEFTKSSVNYPKTLKIGETFSIKGKVSCNKKIEKVKFGIYDSDSKWIEYTEKTVNAKTFDISKVDASVHFGRLLAGSYKYVGQFCIGGTWYKSVIKYSFTVDGANCTLTDKKVNTRIQEMLDVLVPGVSATNSKSEGNKSVYFTTNGKACMDDDAEACNVTKVITKNSKVINLIKNNKGSGTVKTSLFPHHYGPTGITFTLGWSCCGFAGFAGWYIGADKVSSNVDYMPYKIGLAYNKTNMKKYARRGDLIRSATHSCVFLDVNDNGCRVLDSNWGCTCVTSVHTIKWSQSGFSKIGLSRCTIRK